MTDKMPTYVLIKSSQQGSQFVDNIPLYSAEDVAERVAALISDGYSLDQFTVLTTATVQYKPVLALKRSDKEYTDE